MKDQIAKIITDYINKIEVPKEKWDGTVGFFPAEWPLPTCTIADEIAEKLAAAIAPYLEAGANWEDAPEWAEWRTVDGNGDITYWKDKPEPSKRNDYWTLAKGDRYEQIPHTVKDWKETLQERPR